MSRQAQLFKEENFPGLRLYKKNCGIKSFSGRKIIFPGKIVNSQITYLPKKLQTTVGYFWGLIYFSEKDETCPRRDIQTISLKGLFLVQDTAKHLLSFRENYQTQKFLLATVLQ